jgi:hypothetical protein
VLLDGHPSSICRHRDDALHPLESVVTVASVIIELSARRMRLALGPPCEHAHEPVTPEFAQAEEVAYR